MPPVQTPIALGRLCYPGHQWGRLHQVIQAHLMRLLTGQLRLPSGKVCRRLMVQTPPQCGKSTLSSRLFPAVALAQNPKLNILLVSYAGTLAGEHSLACRDHVAEFGRVLRPDGCLDLHPGARARDFWQVKSGGSLKSAGIYGSLTGRPADVAIIDDPFAGFEDSISLTQREKVHATYRSVIQSRLQENGFVVSIGTPWHPDDLRGRLLTSEPEKWCVLRFPALAEENDPLGREPGDPLCPERRSREFWEGIRAGYEADGLSHLWSALYQCNPTADASTVAFSDPTWFHDHIWCDELPLCEANPQRYRVLALDPGKSKTGKTGDYSAFADLTLLADGHVYAETHLARRNLNTQHEYALALIKRAIDEGRPYRAMLVESNMYQESVGVAIQRDLDRLGISLHVDLHQTGGDQEKVARIVTGLSPMLARHKLHFLAKTTSNKLTVTQMKEVPNGSHDDGPDSLELGLQVLNLLVFGNKRPITQKVLRTS